QDSWGRAIPWNTSAELRDCLRNPPGLLEVSPGRSNRLFPPALGAAYNAPVREVTFSLPVTPGPSIPSETTRGRRIDAVSKGVPVNIFVGNMSYETTEDEIRQAFQAHGEVTS